MKKKRPGMDRDGLGSEPPPFICQDRQCSGPMMTRVYGAEGSQSPEDRGEFDDLREDIPVKKKSPLEGLGRY
jgi:hypothetical protein